MSDENTIAPVEKQSKSNKPLYIAIAAVVAVIAIIVAFVLTRGGDEAAAKGTEANPIKIGTVGASTDQWPIFVEKAKEQGIYVELVNFDGYPTVNPETASGALDVNQFQHILYLALYNNESGENLQPFGATAIYPLGLYSLDYDSVDAIPDGSKIAVPDDGTNQARALGVLEANGLIVFKEGTGALTAAPEDVDTAASRVEVVPVKADQTARQLDDPAVAAAVVNNDYVADTGLEPADAIAQDDPTSASAQPFINIWATTDANKDNPTFLKLVEIAQSAEVEAALVEASGGTAVLVHDDAAALRGYLADAEAELKAAG